MIEVGLDTMAVDVVAPPPEFIEQGMNTVNIQVVGGSELPFSDPRNPDQPLRVPSITVNFDMTKKAALKLAALIEEKANELPDDTKSGKLAIVQDMDTANKVAQFEQRLRK